MVSLLPFWFLWLSGNPQLTCWSTQQQERAISVMLLVSAWGAAQLCSVGASGTKARRLGWSELSKVPCWAWLAPLTDRPLSTAAAGCTLGFTHQERWVLSVSGGNWWAMLT